jgi:hypothetical protein
MESLSYIYYVLFGVPLGKNTLKVLKLQMLIVTLALVKIKGKFMDQSTWKD